MPGDEQSSEVIVISYPLVPRFPAALTDAEQEIVERIMNLESNQDIATARGTSTNTVGNQIAAIFEKLGINSRAELARKLHRLCAHCDRPGCDDCRPGHG